MSCGKYDKAILIPSYFASLRKYRHILLAKRSASNVCVDKNVVNNFNASNCL